MHRLTPLLLLALVGCPKHASESTARTYPEPLPTPDFALPATETRTLSNGLQVVVATTTEVPLVDVRIVFDVGAWADPEGRTGLAETTFDLMNDGAGDLDSAGIARALKQLGSTLGTGADADSGVVAASGLKRNLEPTLDLMTLVLTHPTFPDSEWAIIQKQRIANVRLSKEDPAQVARQVGYKLLYGDAYRGRVPSEAAYAAMTTAEMKAFYGEWVGPANAKVFVGGDITADEIVPLLEARLGSWKPEVNAAAPEVKLPMPDAARVYFVDKPGATQSQLRVLLPVGNRTDPDYYSFMMANEVLGAEFTSRVNLNLREDKGYTYGAHCYVLAWMGPGLFVCGTAVRTDATGPALVELKKEVTDPLGARPISAEELAYFQSSLVNGFPAQYETTDAVLGEKVAIWRYGLPADWTERFLPGVRSATPESANGAYAAHIDPNKLVWVVVGDKATVWDDLSALGLEIVELDRDGNRKQGG
jgi:predicted Zn-dependent peptidase